jgi:general secretion pathway protein K
MTARTGQRGAALLVVMVAVAILTALAVQLAYDTRVELQLAGNARDRLRAEHLARSGVALSRLVLALQNQLDQASGAGGGGPTGNRPPQPGQRPQPQQPQLPQGLAIPSVRIWSAVPLDSGIVQALFGGGRAAGADGEAPPGDGPPAARFGDFDGAFAAEIEDEGSKVDAQLDSGAMGGLLGAQVRGLWQLVCDPRWDPLFDREDANGTRISRQDLLMHLHDWTDQDEQTSSLVASFPGPACMMDLPRNPFEAGFGDEDFPYDRGEDRYKAKNDRFDSLDELYLVAGVSDAFMAAFGDRLTVYMRKDAKRTIDPRSEEKLLLLAEGMAEPAGQPVLYDPEFRALLHRLAMQQTMGGLINMTGPQLVQLVTGLGLQVNPVFNNPTSPQNFLGDRPEVFRIRATGAAGDVEVRIDAVVSYARGGGQTQTPARGAAQPGQNTGQLIRWREE